MLNLRDDRMAEGQDGKWFSYQYEIQDDRVFMIGFFNHQGDMRLNAVFFTSSGKFEVSK